MKNKGKRFTSAGTDIDQVKRQNAQANGVTSGFGTNKMMEEFAQEASFSSSNQPSLGKTAAGTDIAHVKSQNAKANNAASSYKMMEEFAQEASFSSSNKPSLGKTVAGTDIAEVKRQNANPKKS